MLLGDYNFPFLVNWNEVNPFINSIESERIQSVHLSNLLEKHLLQQIIDIPTRGKNILDLVMINNKDLVTKSEVVVNKVISDHNTINMRLGLTIDSDTDDSTDEPADTEVDIIKVDDIDFFRVRWALNKVEWEVELENKDTDEALSFFMNKMNEVNRTLLPPKGKKKEDFEENNKTEKREKRFTSNNMIPRNIRVLFRKKRILSKKILLEKNPLNIIKLKKSLAETENEIKKSYDEWNQEKENKLINNISEDPKAFYKYAKSKSKIESGIGPLEDENGECTSKPEQMAEILRAQYEKVFSTPKPEFIVENNKEFFKTSEDDSDALTDLEIHEEDIEEAIGLLRTGSSAGPDKVHAKWLKETKEAIKKPLCLILRKSLNEGIFPTELKVAEITPIYKSKEKSQAKNYRPVSLTSNIAKIFERVVRKTVVKHLESKNLLNNDQHGFRQGRSCLSQLLAHIDKVTDKVIEEGNADVVYLDFQKAFDKCDHNLLKHKLKEVKIKGKMGVWLSNFLQERFQRVKVGKKRSKMSKVISGVPQGTVLGPIIFLILINNINDSVNKDIVSTGIFADDTLLTAKISNESDVENFQEELNKIYQWETNNNMKFNSEKFELMRYGNNEELKNSTDYFTPDFTDIIERKMETRDLGIQMNEDLSFKSHIELTRKKIKQKIGWILRSFQTRTPQFMKKVWKSLILPHADYGCQVWYTPDHLGEISTLEELQRNYTKRITGQKQNNYWQRLENLRIYSLQRRYERYFILYTWKILEGMVPDCGIKVLISDRRGRYCPLPPLPKTRSKLINLKEQTFQIWGPKLFNCLPSQLRNMTGCGIDKFKACLDNYLQLIPDEPKTETLTPRFSSLHTNRASNSLVDATRSIQLDQTLLDKLCGLTNPLLTPGL